MKVSRIETRQRNIAVLVPFTVRQQRMMDKRALSILMFARRILDKYSSLGMYGFDEAAMVLLEKISEFEKQDNKDIQRHIEYTVKLMLVRQNRNRLAQDIINGNTAFQKQITHHVMVNLNRILNVDKRVYSELSQISRNNVQIKEAYDRIVKLENYEKKLVFQIQNQQMVKPAVFQNSVYQMFQRMLNRNQLKLSNQILKDSITRKEFKQNLNRLLELKNFRTDMERHEFLHVMKSGTLEERREAMGILKDAVMEVNQSYMKKSITHIVRNEMTSPLVYQQIQVEQNTRQKKELDKLKELVARQQTIQTEDRHLFTELKTKLSRQDELVNKIIKEQEVKWKQETPSSVSEAITRQLKSEIHLDKMRYGME